MLFHPTTITPNFNMKKYIILNLFVFFTISVNAQELSCKVNIDVSQLKGVGSQTADKQTIKELENAIKNFMNNTRWTKDIFADQEKIKCNLNINLLTSPAQNVFSGNAQFQVVRPVHNSDYETVTFQYVDQNFDISFLPEERQMIFNEQSFTSNLTSILAFYAMVALAVDYDSFSLLGGDEFVQRAFNVVNLASQLGGAWTQVNDKRVRYWVVENLQNQQLNPFRKGLYTYHRIVLDDFANNSASKRGQVLAFLKDAYSLQLLNQKAILIDIFMDAKAQELVKMFSEAPPEERKEAFDILTKLAPEKTELYRPLMQ